MLRKIHKILMPQLYELTFYWSERSHFVAKDIIFLLMGKKALFEKSKNKKTLKNLKNGKFFFFQLRVLAHDFFTPFLFVYFENLL